MNSLRSRNSVRDFLDRIKCGNRFKGRAVDNLLSILQPIHSVPAQYRDRVICMHITSEKPVAITV